MEKTIGILGAAGRVGEAAAAAFLKAGWNVRGVARGAKANTLLPGVTPVVTDARDADSLVEACAGADVILHALNPKYDEWEDKVLPLAEAVLRAAEKSGSTVIIPGNVYNFGHALGVDMTETTPFRPREGKGLLRVQMEDMFRSAADRGVRTIVLRGGDYFGGARPETWLDLMIGKDLRRNRIAWPGAYDTVHSFCYLPDFAATMVQLAERRDQLEAFSVFHFAGHNITGEQFKAAVEAATGRQLNAGGVPWFLLKLVALFNPVLREVLKMRYLWDVPHSLNGAKLEATIGHEPHTPLVEAVGDAIRDLKLDEPKSGVALRAIAAA